MKTYRLIAAAVVVAELVMGAVLIWHGIAAVKTLEEWSRDNHGALVIPEPATGHDPHPSPVGPSVVTTPRGSGTRVIVPAVGIDAPITGQLSQRGDGGWYPPAHGVAQARQSAPLTASSGTTMLAGHVWSVGDPGVFFTLHKVHLGNEIAITSGGRVDLYRVTDITVTPKTKLPEWAWGTPGGPRRVILVTCGGHETGEAGHRTWDSNVIVTATITNVRNP